MFSPIFVTNISQILEVEKDNKYLIGTRRLFSQFKIEINISFISGIKMVKTCGELIKCTNSSPEISQIRQK
jgi:hypothetical protein